jgi:hypothetical protein
MIGLVAFGVAVVGGGAWLRWAVGPVVMAYEIGRRAERIRATISSRAGAR